MDYHPSPWEEDHTTVQHHIMIKKHFDMTGDLDLCQIIKASSTTGTSLSNWTTRRAKGKPQKTAYHKAGPWTGPSPLECLHHRPTTFPTMPPFHLCWQPLCHHSTGEFQKIEPGVPSKRWQPLTTTWNAIHHKTQLCCFHLRNLENKWLWMKVSWDGHQLPSPSFKTYLQNTKAKVNTCNNIWHKQENWPIHQPSVPLP